MKPKASWLAWAFFGLVCVGVTHGWVYELSILKPGTEFMMLVIELIVSGLIPVVFAFVGALIVSRQPNNLIGWLLFGPAFAGFGSLLPDVQSWTSLPPQVTWSEYLGLWLSGWSWLLLIFPIFLIMLLFPTGRPPSPRWNWVGYLALGMVAVFLFLNTFDNTFSIEAAGLELPNPIGFIPSTWSGPVFLAFWSAGLLVLAVSSVTSLVIRYRRAAPLEREQIKWLVFTCGLFGSFYAVTVIFFTFSGLILIDTSIVGVLTFLAMTAIPVSIAIAILRYRLWDIDVLIRRTLVYGALTLTLALVYFGSVVLMESLLTAAGGPRSAVVTVISTLLIAALFNPLRKRIQNDIDRRFYRKKYDAEKIVAAFGMGLREKVDLDNLQIQIMSVVEETLQPENLSLWLRPVRRPGPEPATSRFPGQPTPISTRGGSENR